MTRVAFSPSDSIRSVSFPLEGSEVGRTVLYFSFSGMRAAGVPAEFVSFYSFEDEDVLECDDTSVLVSRAVAGRTVRSQNALFEDVRVAPFTSLAGGDFRGVRLGGVNFRGGDLSFATFDGGLLRGADLSGCSGEHVSFDGTSCFGASFRYARFLCGFFRDGNFAKVNFDGADLSFSEFDSVVLTGSSFNGTILRGVRFENVDLSLVDLSSAILD